MSSNHDLEYTNYAYAIKRDPDVVPVDDGLYPPDTIFIQFRLFRQFSNYHLSEESGEPIFEPIARSGTEQVLVQEIFFPIEKDSLLEDDSVLSTFLSQIRIPMFYQQNLIPEIKSAMEALISHNLPRGIVVAILHITSMPFYEDIENSVIARVTSQSLDDRFDQSVPASKSSVEELGKFIFEGSGGSEKCMVCLEEIMIGAEATCMPCMHVFHGDCILQWLETSHLCPLCRFKMPTDISS